MRNRWLLAVLFLMSTVQAFASPASSTIGLDVSLIRGRSFYKFTADNLFALSPGSFKMPLGATILTFSDGIAFLHTKPLTELRLKEDSTLALPASSTFELRKGIVGVSNKTALITFATPHLKMEIADAVLVIKTNPILTRVCVVKGKVHVWQGKSLEKLLLNAGQEISAAQGQLSKAYKSTDELRYTWYWTEPDKEPSLQ